MPLYWKRSATSIGKIYDADEAVADHNSSDVDTGSFEEHTQLDFSSLQCGLVLAFNLVLPQLKEGPQFKRTQSTINLSSHKLAT